MSTIPFDTHAFYVELVESGLAEKTAEALTKAVTKIELAKIEELATKRDLKEMDTSLQLKIEQTKSELQRWMVTVVLGTAILQTAIIAALILKLTAHI
ncbi:MAG: CCDC90 family protein [Methylococcaceae bacterium]|jgi:hypothetical protein|nr:CCDC90 family protein [Methylococcaceae bacterium]MDD1606986.1 CCDC90 family protein [Methylococcaceae bacterium]